MEDVSVTREFDRQVEVAAVFQTGRVASGPFSAKVVPLIDVLEFRTDNAGMQIVEPAVEAEAVHVALIRSMIAQLADGSIDIGIIRHHGTAISERAEVLLNDEADRGRIAQMTDLEIRTV